MKNFLNKWCTQLKNKISVYIRWTSVTVRHKMFRFGHIFSNCTEINFGILFNKIKNSPKIIN